MEEMEELQLQLQLPTLPDGIIMDILSRLPVDTLCRFKCVSKHWLASISDHHLASMQLIRALQDDIIYLQRQRLIISFQGKLYTIQVPAIDNSDDKLMPVAISLELPINLNQISDHSEPKDSVQILGSCDGLVCVATDVHSFFLLNPTSREFKKLPDPPVDSNSNRHGFPIGWVTGCGFGYDELHDDYKVVKISNGRKVSVYSLKANYWRKAVPLLPFYINDLQPATYLNGALHWVASREEEFNQKSLLIAFHLADETYCEVPSPDLTWDCSCYITAVVGNCLCIFYALKIYHGEFWLMNEYGVGQSWTKIEISLPYYTMKPLCYLNDEYDEAIFICDGLVLYNFEDQTYKELNVRGIPAGEGLLADSYVESLISPNAHDRIHG